MSSQTAKLPAEVSGLARPWLEHLPELAGTVTDVLRQKEGFYQRITRRELGKVCEARLRYCLTALVERREIELDGAVKIGRTAAMREIPLPAVLRGFRIAGALVSQSLTGTTLDESDSDRWQLATSVRRMIDDYADVLTAAYREVAAEPAEPRTGPGFTDFDTLLEGHVLDESVLEGIAAGLFPGGAHSYVVIVADRSANGAAPSAEFKPPRWQAAWRPERSGEIGIVALSGPDEGTRLRQSLGRLSFSAGLSRPVGKLTEIPTAGRQARIARRCLPSGSAAVERFGANPVATLLAESPSPAAELATVVLGPVLALLPSEQKVLFDTVRAWYAAGGSANRAAKELFVHPNTVRYRIRRLQKLTGRELTDPKAASEVYAATEAVRLWPVTAEWLSPHV